MLKFLKAQLSKVAQYKREIAVGVVTPVALISSYVSAAPVDLTGLTTSIDFSTTTAAILLAAGALMTVYTVIKASIFVMGMIKRG